MKTFATVVIWLVLVGQAGAASVAADAIRQRLEEAYATTILLADGEAIQLGLVNFNPNDYARLEDENLGTADSVAGRETLGVFSLPLELELPVSLTEHDLHAGLRFSLLREVERGKLATSTNPQEDRFETRVFSAEANVRWRYHLTESWSLEAGQALYLMRYENHTDFRNPDSRQLQPSLDGLVTNISSEAWVSRSTAGAVWRPQLEAAWTELFTSFNYLSGNTIQPSRTEHDAEPEAWYWRNGVRSKLPIFINSGAAKHLILKLSRVNVGGDLRNPMGSSVFYEAGIGYINSTNGRIPFVRNLGVFLNFNYGSDLRGGTLGVLYNVD